MNYFSPPNKVLDNLYIGTQVQAQRKSQLEELKIKAVVNASNDEDYKYFLDVFTYFHVEIDDIEEESIIIYFEKIYDFVDQFLN